MALPEISPWLKICTELYIKLYVCNEQSNILVHVRSSISSKNFNLRSEVDSTSFYSGPNTYWMCQIVERSHDQDLKYPIYCIPSYLFEFNFEYFSGICGTETWQKWVIESNHTLPLGVWIIKSHLMIQASSQLFKYLLWIECHPINTRGHVSSFHPQWNAMLL